jgi:hypothetical protein
MLRDLVVWLSCSLKNYFYFATLPFDQGVLVTL